MTRPIWGSTRLVRACIWLIGMALALFLVLPFLVLVPISFNSGPYLEFPPRGFSLQWYYSFLNRPGWLEAALTSVWVGSLTVLLAVPIGVTAAWSLVRCQIRLRAIITGVIILPIVFPAIVLAIAMYMYFVSLHILGSLIGLVVAHTVLAVPFVVIVIKASLEGVDESFERAARSLGGGPVRVFRTITLPLIRPAIFAGSLLAFVTSFDEVVLAIFLTAPDTVTLPRKMWESVNFEVDPTSSAVATILIVSSCGLFAMAGLIRRIAKGWRR